MHTDPTNVKVRARREAEREDARAAAAAATRSHLKDVAGTESGRALLWQMLRPMFCRLHDSNGLILARNVGQHDAAASLWADLEEACRDRLLLIINEHLTTA